MYELRNTRLRGLRCWLLFSLAFVSLSAAAADVYKYAPPAEGYTSGSYSTVQAACDAAGAAYIAYGNTVSPAATRTVTSTSVSGMSCIVYYHAVSSSTGTQFDDYFGVTITLETSTCTAGPAGFHRGVVAGEKVNPFNTCLNNCVTSAIPRLDLGVSVTTGTPVQTYATWELLRKAESCDSSSSSLPSLPAEGNTSTQPTPEPACPEGQRRAYLANGSPTCQPIPVDRFCPVGYTYGTVNGKDTCISQGDPGNSAGPPVVDKAPAVQSGESSTTTTNPDGSTTKVTTTTDGKGGGSITTTTTSADGKTTSSVTTKMEPPKAEADKKCEPGTAGCAALGTPADGVVAKNEVNVGTITPDSLSGFNIGNQCPADMTFDALGKTFAVGFKPACDASVYVKPLVLLLSAMAALGIVYAALTAKA